MRAARMTIVLSCAPVADDITPAARTTERTRLMLADAVVIMSMIRGRPYAGVVSVEPFFAKIIASSLAGCVWLAFLDTSCVAPGGS